MHWFLSENNNSHLILNIGTGKGTSVLELVNTFQEINKVKISYRFASRRDGDVGIVFANTNLSQKLLGWTAKRSLAQMCRMDGNGLKKSNLM